LSLIDRDRAVLWHPYTQMLTAPAPLPITRAEGVWLYTEDGRRILDGISSWWVNIHGHSHPKLNAALAAQARELEHVVFAGCTHRPAVELAERLVEILPKGLERVFYSDNGSTLGAVNFVEVALPTQENTTRFMHIHRDVPGVMAKISDVFSRRKINLAGQYLRTDGEIGYVVTDVTGRVQVGMCIRKELEAIDGTVRTRFLYEAPQG